MLKEKTSFSNLCSVNHLLSTRQQSLQLPLCFKNNESFQFKRPTSPSPLRPFYPGLRLGGWEWEGPAHLYSSSPYLSLETVLFAPSYKVTGPLVCRGEGEKEGKHERCSWSWLLLQLPLLVVIVSLVHTDGISGPFPWQIPLSVALSWWVPCHFFQIVPQGPSNFRRPS